MSEQEKQENQKTIVAFAAGLLIGGLLVWVFGGTPDTKVDDNNDTATTTEETTDSSDDTDDTDTSTSSDDTEAEVEAPVMQTGDGKIEVTNQPAGTRVGLQSAVFPSDDGWIGVRDYVNGQPAGLLGVARYSKSQGLIPEDVILQRSTKSGSTYAVVFYSESGDKVFSLADDKQIEGVISTFTAN